MYQTPKDNEVQENVICYPGETASSLNSAQLLVNVLKCWPTFNDSPLRFTPQHLVSIHLVLLVSSHHSEGNFFLDEQKQDQA